MEITVENYNQIARVSRGDILILPLPPTPYHDNCFLRKDNSNYRMFVEQSFLQDCYQNDTIFTFLEVSKVPFCAKAYGYSPVFIGGCPECRRNDYAALTRLVKNIFDKYISMVGSLPEKIIIENINDDIF